jgi:Transposase DDE domain group 1
MTRPAERVVAFYNHRGTAEQYIKEGKNAVTWIRLSCRRFTANAVRLQLHALASNLGNFLRNRVVKIGAKIVRHGRSITFQLGKPSGVTLSENGSPDEELRFRSSIHACTMLTYEYDRRVGTRRVRLGD